MMLIAALMLAQAPVAGATAQPVAKKKPDQVCQYVEVTGSHQRQKVCHDKSEPAPADQSADFASDAPAGMLKAQPLAQPAASLGSPR